MSIVWLKLHHAGCPDQVSHDTCQYIPMIGIAFVLLMCTLYTDTSSSVLTYVALATCRLTLLLH